MIVALLEFVTLVVSFHFVFFVCGETRIVEPWLPTTEVWLVSSNCRVRSLGPVNPQLWRDRQNRTGPPGVGQGAFHP